MKYISRDELKEKLGLGSDYVFSLIDLEKKLRLYLNHDGELWFNPFRNKEVIEYGFFTIREFN